MEDCSLPSSARGRGAIYSLGRGHYAVDGIATIEEGVITTDSIRQMGEIIFVHIIFRGIYKPQVFRQSLDINTIDTFVS